MKLVVEECICFLFHLYEGQLGFLFRIVNDIFKEVDKHIEDGNLVKEFKMSALPTLYDHVVKLITYLVCISVAFHNDFLWSLTSI